ncbi:sulfotransferase [Pseudoruegeria sp. HB172150]|uniref:sulfotransferase n=1 Tax=Pseudoruegeria sp. HB172150 TaxID=2721164 RepID=UPI0015562C45|nr:sulfotransferase [Pseudoruegeria sp. HB172150]
MAVEAGAVVVALLAVAAFAAVLVRSRALPIAGGLAGIAVSGVSTMLDGSLDDDTKERAVREAGLRLLLGAWGIAWRIALAAAGVLLPILAADGLGLVPLERSLGVLTRADFILLVSALAIAAGWMMSRVRNSHETAANGLGDRMLHAFAFSGPATLKGLARLDDRLFARTLAETPDAPPIFITSLARGGTTALLNAMHDLPGIATHLYQDMPFISAPLLWSRLSGRRATAERERAHGDGLAIGLDSPEAFDEVFWRLHWPGKYGERQIELWKNGDASDESRAFFTRHFRKIAALRHPDDTSGVRYLSKNNANLARLRLLPEMFPGCDIVVPLRGPAAHAASLHRQHMNFTRLHGEDEFALRYMRDIGHLEFGALHRLLGFDPDIADRYRPDDPNYWLAYWYAAFSEAARNADRLHIVTQDALRQSPQATMDALLERLSLTGRRDFSTQFHSGTDEQPCEMFDPRLLREAVNLYDDLAAGAVR